MNFLFAACASLNVVTSSARSRPVIDAIRPRRHFDVRNLAGIGVERFGIETARQFATLPVEHLTARRRGFN